MDHDQRAPDQTGWDSVGAAYGPPLFCVGRKRGEKRSETLQKEKKPIGRPTIHLFQGDRKRKKPPKSYRNRTKRKKKRDAENEQETVGGMGLLPQPPRPDHLQRPVPQLPARLQASFQAQIVACRKYRNKRSETWR